MAMKTKTFDCVEFQRQAGRAITEITRGMTAEQQAAYWAERTHALKERLSERRRAEPVEQAE